METLFLDPYTILLLAGFIGFFMAFGIGANDVANSMGTSVGSNAITIKQAIIIAAIFEFLGAFLAGGEVTSTIRKGIIDPNIYANDINIFIIGMMSALLAGGTWLYIASLKGWPVSTTHSIVGSIIGFALITKGVDAVSWGKVGNIAMSWITSPLFSGALAFGLYISAKKLILDRSEPEKAAITFIPMYSFMVAVVISLVTARKGLKHVGIEWTDNEIYLFILLFSSIVALGTAFFLRTNKEKILRDGGIEFAFGLLMIVSASAMAFAHGSNDVANAIGPLAAIVSVVDTGEIGSKAAISPWILFIGGIGIVFGLATLGSRVIETVGKKITNLTPSLGFSAEMATASTVVAASYLGFPISTTHTLVGGVIGVGLAKGVEHLDLSSIKRIIASWLVTIPAGAAFTILFYILLRLIFGI
ncbi:inorganic phosphate transporter [Gammaproteobacteria bacterium]|jgi:PiT family inorganic phosphate transporter|nr:inorganic phosphate transporter [Gammaproteobacteria bacterium]MDA9094439.1 inorganic phosphate transporter [Gammaproteobacteria bacterium]MDA9112189.1 inorganic phosphate transporter [Gammaproteobacteria bacterium]MDC1190741.1 inorganic phosphate transporter [Gammaproteobacteria bacterium]